MTSETVKPTIIEPFGKHTATVIFLHGEGDESNGWAEKISTLIDLTYTRLIFPKAAKLPVSLYRGMLVPAWYDMYPQDYTGNPEDLEGLKRSYDDIVKLIDCEIKGTSKNPGIPASRIVLAGFSQGGSMAFHVGISAPVLIGGVINLSGHIPLMKYINWNEIKKPYVMMCQGDSDILLPINQLLAISRTIRNCLNVVFHIYDGIEHDTCDDEMEDIKKFVAECLPLIKELE